MGGKSFARKPGRFSRFNKNSQLAKLGSMMMLRSENWRRKEACPIHVSANSPGCRWGKRGTLKEPPWGVIKAFQTISRKKVLGLKWLLGVSSLNDLGNRRLGPRTSTG